jgi:hypothetical protein
MPRIALGAVVAAAMIAIALVGYLWLSRDASDLASQTRIVAPGLVGLEAPAGRRLLFESEAPYEPLFPLISHFET